VTDRPPASAPRTSRVLLVAALLLYLAGAAGSLAGLRWQIPFWGALVFGGLRVAGLGTALGGALARRYGPAATTGALLALSLLCLAIPVDLFAVPAAISVVTGSWAFSRVQKKTIPVAAGFTLLFVAGVARMVVEFFWPELLPALPLVVGGALGIWLLVVHRGGLVVHRGVGAALAVVAVGAALAIRVHGLLSADQQFDLQMVGLLGFFIIGAILVAAGFTHLFVAAFDHLERDPLLSFQFFLPILALPAGALGWAWQDAEIFSRQGALAPAFAEGAALDLVLLLGGAVALAIRALGRRIGVRRPSILVAWKFLRSQRLVLTPAARTVNRLRDLVPHLGATGVPLWASPARWAVVAGAGLLVWLAMGPMGVRWTDPIRFEWLAWLLGAAAMGLAVRGLLRPRGRIAETAADLAPGLLGLAVALLIRPDVELGDLAFPGADRVPLIIVLLVGALLAAHLALRTLLWLRRRRGTLAETLQPELAPCLDSRLRQGVGLSMFVSIVGVAVGVWALIVVLSVMRGFSEDLTSKIVKSREHVVLRATDDLAGIDGPYALARRLNGLAAVRSASPYVEANVMLASTSNIGVNITLRGIVPEDYAGGDLEATIVAGSTRFLREPEWLVPPDYLGYAMLEDEVQEELFADVPSRELADQPLSDPSRELVDRPPSDPNRELVDRPPIDPGAIPMDPIPGMGDDAAEDMAFERDWTADQVVLPPVLIGVELAGSLGVDVGGKVELIAPDGEAGPAGLQPKARSFRIAGLFTTGLYDYDMKLAYTTLGEAQRFLNMEDAVNRVEARLHDLDAVDGVRAEVLGWVDPERVEVDDWKRMNRNLFSALELEWVVMFLVLGFVVLIASFSIVSSLLMIIRQRTDAISILRCMGFRVRDMGRVFLTLGALVGLLGSLSGLLMGVSSCILVQHVGITLPKEYYIRQLPVDLDPLSIAVIVLASWALTVLASLYPARRASRTHILEGLSHGK
jgi:ABC-type lipoprotein release transport system permease subunit